MLSLIDNREVSPAPVSQFALKTLGNNMGSNRVTLPFNRVNSFKPTADKPVTEKLAAWAAEPVYVNVNFKFLQPDQNATSLTQLINNHGIGIKSGFGAPQRGLLLESEQGARLKRSQSQNAFLNMKKLDRPDLKAEVSNLSSNVEGNTLSDAIKTMSGLLPSHNQTTSLKVGTLPELRLPSGGLL